MIKLKKYYLYSFSSHHSAQLSKAGIFYIRANKTIVVKINLKIKYEFRSLTIEKLIAVVKYRFLMSTFRIYNTLRTYCLIMEQISN